MCITKSYAHFCLWKTLKYRVIHEVIHIINIFEGLHNKIINILSEQAFCAILQNFIYYEKDLDKHIIILLLELTEYYEIFCISSWVLTKL